MSVANDATAARDPLAAWCGWVMIGASVLVAPIGWLWPLGFSALLSLMGLLCLPAVRIGRSFRVREEDLDRYLGERLTKAG